MNREHGYDPVKRALVVGDPRLTRILQMDPERCASVSEYAAATGIDTGRVIDLLGPALDAGTLGFEPVGPEIFIHTAPSGRPVPRHLPEVAPNLWERLRMHGDTQQAYDLWRLYRALEEAGWKVEANTNRICFDLGPLPHPPQLAVEVSGRLAPLLLHPTQYQLADPNGRLRELGEAGALVVGAVVDSGALDEAITAVRAYHHTGSSAPSVLVLEAPRYNPVPVTAQDASVAPRSASMMTLKTDSKNEGKARG